MRNTNNINQNYVTEDKILAQKKLVLKMKLAALGTVLGITGIGIYYQNQSKEIINNHIKKENNNESVNIFQEENLIDGKWIKGRIIFTTSENVPVAVDEKKRVAFLGIYEGTLDSLKVEIDSEYVFINDKIYFTYEDEKNHVNRYIYQEENLVDGEWIKGDLSITDGIIPQSIMDRRYILLDTSFNLEKETNKEKSLKLR